MSRFRPPIHLLIACLVLGAAGGVTRAQDETAAEPSPPVAPRSAVPLEERGYPAIRTYLPRDYSGHNQIWCVAEARNGLLYFGAHSEVIEFDGITWRAIPVPGAAFIRAVTIDDDERIWTAGVNEFGELRPDESGRLNFFSLRPQLPADIEQIGDVRTIHAMADGIYFQSDNYLLRWNGEQLQIWPMHERYVRWRCAGAIGSSSVAVKPG